MTRPVGTCRLCLKHSVQLCESHIVPKFAYRRLRGTGRNPNPVMFDGRIALQVSKQVKEYLLCRQCEDRFMKVEEQVAPLVYSDLGFPIFAELGGIVGARAQAREFGTHSREVIAYFLASVIWRGSVPQGISSSLGVHEEAFRLFLLGGDSFPANAEAMVSVLGHQEDPGVPEMYRLITLPWCEAQHGYDLHRFILCGCLFALWVGPRLPPPVREHGTVRGQEPLILIGDHRDVFGLLWDLVDGSENRVSSSTSQRAEAVS